MKLFVMPFSPVFYYFLSDPTMFLSTLFPNIISLFSSFNVRDQVSLPYNNRKNGNR
jgi:hypothetical protein